MMIMLNRSNRTYLKMDVMCFLIILLIKKENFPNIFSVYNSIHTSVD